MTPCVILLRFIHVVVCTKVYCFYVAENYPIIAQDILYLFGHSPVDGHLDCFQFLGSLNKVARNNIHVQVFV